MSNGSRESESDVPKSNPTLKTLEQQLSSTNVLTRARAAYLLGLMGSHARPIRQSIEKLTTDYTYLKWSPTMITIDSVSEDGIRYAAIARGDDPLKWMRTANVAGIASAALRRIDTMDYTDCKDDIQRFIKQLCNEAWDIRWHAAETLGTVGDKRAIEPLISALEIENDSDIRKIIVEALQKLTNKKFGENAQEWKEWLKTVEGSVPTVQDETRNEQN